MPYFQFDNDDANDWQQSILINHHCICGSEHANASLEIQLILIVMAINVGWYSGIHGVVITDYMHTYVTAGYKAEACMILA